jgi:hypothetical protein
MLFLTRGEVGFGELQVAVKPAHPICLIKPGWQSYANATFQPTWFDQP